MKSGHGPESDKRIFAFATPAVGRRERQCREGARLSDPARLPLKNQRNGHETKRLINFFME